VSSSCIAANIETAATSVSAQTGSSSCCDCVLLLQHCLNVQRLLYVPRNIKPRKVKLRVLIEWKIFILRLLKKVVKAGRVHHLAWKLQLPLLSVLVKLSFVRLTVNDTHYSSNHRKGQGICAEAEYYLGT
jgi:hypothetical protein